MSIKKIVFTILFCLIPTICFGQKTQDYWVYVRLEDRSGVTSDDDKGMSKKDDVIAALPKTKQFIPSAKEKQEYLIFEASLTEVQRKELTIPKIEVIDDVAVIKAYRKNKLNLTELGIIETVGQKENKINSKKIKYTEKTSLDFARYEAKRLFYVLVTRPFKIAANKIIPYAFAETISTINKTGEDYNTITLWEDAKNGDLVTATSQETGALYDDDGVLDDTVIIDGSTTNSSYYMKITSPPGERHGGTIASGATIKHGFGDTDSSSIISIQDDYTKVEWLIVIIDGATPAGNGGSNAAIFCTVSNANGATANNNITVGSGLTSYDSSNRGIYFYTNADTSNTGYIQNNISYGWTTSSNGGTGIKIYANNYRHHNVIVYNNTTYGNVEGMAFGAGVNDTASVYTAKNNIAVGNTTDFTWTANATMNNDYNCSEDATATGANSITTGSDTDFTSVTGGSEDFHLVAGAVEIDVGVDLGTTNGVNFDIDNRDRDAEGDTWDIGGHEFVSAAGGGDAATSGNRIFKNIILKGVKL